MEHSFIDKVHDSLSGCLQEQYRVPGVECIWEKDSLCLQLYGQVLDTYQRLCNRLGEKDDDADVEIIINNLMEIEKEMSRLMYRYGAMFGMPNE